MSAPAVPPTLPPSSWQLTAEVAGLTRPTDALSPGAVYEVGTDGASVATTLDVWSAWTGERWINGVPHHGPVYHMGTRQEYTGPRSCGCSTCQATVAPACRAN